MVTKIINCRHCGSENIIKFGKTPNHKQRYRCHDCGKQSRENPTVKYTEEQKEMILRVYQERSSLRGLQRAFGVSPNTVLSWLKKRQSLRPLKSTILAARRHDVIELDELWFFVGRKSDAQWVWIALCRRTRQILSYAIGPRDWYRCRELYERLPRAYKRCATYSDFWSTYDEVFPHNRSVGKETGETAHVERWNNTLRQRLGRFTRKTLSFSKLKSMHETCLRLFIHQYNQELATIPT